MDLMSEFAYAVLRKRYCHSGESSMRDVARRVVRAVFSAAPDSMVTRDLAGECEELVASRVFLPGGRYLYAAGRPYHQVNNCFLFRAEDSREGWARLLHDVTSTLMTGGGVGIDYSDLRMSGAPLLRMGGFASGPVPLMKAVNEVGRGVRMGGSRRAAIWAGLRWDHPDAKAFLRVKDWSPALRELKAQDHEFPLEMEYTNVSLILDGRFFDAYCDGLHPDFEWAREVFDAAVRRMLRTGEPGFSVNIDDPRESLRNACTELTSADDGDVCNLGSINLARVSSPAEMRRVVEVATAFLLAGTLYSDVPFARVAEVREKNRRLGLGLMGLHEWFLQRGKRYMPTPDLHPWLDAYAESGTYARKYAAEWGISCPVKTRAVAPTGTIGIVAETTTGVEPVFCVAYKRRWYEGERRREEVVVDPAARRAVEAGAHPDDVEDAYSIDAPRRLGFQGWLQRWVDHAISSTVNLPAWGSKANCEDTLSRYSATLIGNLPMLRGVTMFPDGSRGFQPLERCSYREATEGVRVESADVCDLRGGESCGS